MKPMVIKKHVDDYISSMISNDDGKILVTTSGDGYVTSIDIGTRYIIIYLIKIKNNNIYNII